MNVYNESSLSGRPSCVAKTLTLDMTLRLFNRICAYLPCLQAPLTLLSFYKTFIDLDLVWGSQGQREPNLLASFSPTLFV